MKESIEKLNSYLIASNYTEAYRLACVLKEANEHEAYWVLGDCFFFGWGVERDFLEGVACYEKAVVLGSYKSALTLGRIYGPKLVVENYNQVITDDEVRAAEFYIQSREMAEKMAAIGDAEAMYYLGTIHESGLGVEENYRTAFEYFKRAYSLGYKFSLNKLYEYYAYKNSEFFDEARALECMKALNESGLRVIK